MSNQDIAVQSYEEIQENERLEQLGGKSATEIKIERKDVQLNISKAIMSQVIITVTYPDKIVNTQYCPRLITKPQLRKELHIFFTKEYAELSNELKIETYIPQEIEVLADDLAIIIGIGLGDVRNVTRFNDDDIRYMLRYSYPTREVAITGLLCNVVQPKLSKIFVQQTEDTYYERQLKEPLKQQDNQVKKEDK